MQYNKLSSESKHRKFCLATPEVQAVYKDADLSRASMEQLTHLDKLSGLETEELQAFQQKIGGILEALRRFDEGTNNSEPGRDEVPVLGKKELEILARTLGSSTKVTFMYDDPEQHPFDDYEIEIGPDRIYNVYRHLDDPGLDMAEIGEIKL